MKFRIISDLHIDINAHYEDDNLLKFDPDAFYLIAGDTSGSYADRSRGFCEISADVSEIPAGGENALQLSACDGLFCAQTLDRDDRQPGPSRRPEYLQAL